jgi:hypothetical protein
MFTRPYANDISAYAILRHSRVVVVNIGPIPAIRIPDMVLLNNNAT